MKNNEFEKAEERGFQKGLAASANFVLACAYRFVDETFETDELWIEFERMAKHIRELERL